MTTHIEVLYFDGCPNHEPLIDRVRELAAQHGVPAEIEPVRIASEQEAQAQRFLGSPTLRVDGADVEPGADDRRDYGLKCRLYRGATRLTGSPDDAWILAALARAGDQRSGPSRTLIGSPDESRPTSSNRAGARKTSFSKRG